MEEVIKQIKKELLTQDNRITDQPMFLVMEKKEYPTSEYYSYSRSFWVGDEGEIGETLEDVKEYLRDNGEADEKTDEELNNMSDSEISDEYEVRKVYVFEVDTFVQAFFTEKSAKEYIEENNHRLNKPFTYAGGTYRNYEMQNVRKFIMNFGED